MDKKRPGGEFGKRLKERFLSRKRLRESYRSHTAGGIDAQTEPPRDQLGINIQSFFNFQGKAVKPVCECGTYIHERAYWIGHHGPLCYGCYLRGDKK